MVQKDSTTTRGLNRSRSVLLAAVGAFLMSAAVATAQENREGIAYSGYSPPSVGPWDVILYEHPNYLGPWVRYTLQPGMRQRLVPEIVPALEDKVSSIQVGEKVGVRVFQHRRYFADESDGKDAYKASVPSLGTNTLPLNDKISSLIIFPKAAGGAFGVQLNDETALTVGNIAFFPLPEWEASPEEGYPFLGEFNLDKNANGVYAYPYESRNRIELILYAERNFQGRTLTLPGATGWDGMKANNLGNFDFSDTAASLRVRWKGAPLALGPPALAPLRPFTTQVGIDLPGRDIRRFEVDGGSEECEKACNAEAQCQAYTWVKPGVQAPKGVCWLKSSVPARVPDSKCVSGWIEEGTPTPGATPTQTPAPSKAAIGFTEKIRGFQVVQRDGRRVRFRIDYTINSTHGPSIGVGTWLYAGGEAFGGYEPVMFAPEGHGSVEQWVTLPPETHTYDEVEFFCFEPGQQPFLKVRLTLGQTWAP